MPETPLPDHPSLKHGKYSALLALGLGMTLTAEAFTHNNLRGYTAGAVAFILFSKPLVYFLILGVVAAAIAGIRKNVRTQWFPALAWLFFAAGLFDIATNGYAQFILRPKLDSGLTSADYAPGRGQLYIDEEIGFSVVFPEKWMIVYPKNDETFAIEGLFFDDKDRLVKVEILDLESAVENMVETTTPQALFDCTFGLVGGTLIDYGYETVGGRKAMWMRTQVGKNKYTAFTRTYFISEGKRVFQLKGETVTGGNEWFRHNESTIIKVVKSFRLGHY